MSRDAYEILLVSITVGLILGGFGLVLAGAVAPGLVAIIVGLLGLVICA